ncbi:MAG: hypothetical protein L3J71_17880 [Victivallaceae bacterium]|nr:hypothetical protein [Victivallaceae bacterium]
MKKYRPKIKCRYCSKKVDSDAHNAYHQYCCLDPCCQRQRKLDNNRAWREKQKQINPDYLNSESERVKKYQRNHPGYWKKKRKKTSPNELLRDFSCAGEIPENMPLRDFVIFQQLCFKGFMITMGGVLRDDIAKVMNNLYDIGNGTVPCEKTNNMEVKDNAQRISQSGTFETHATGVRLGRPSPGT